MARCPSTCRTSHSLIYPFACMQIGRTALMLAAAKGNAACLSALIQAKADVDQKAVVRLGANVVLVVIWGCMTRCPPNCRTSHCLIYPFACIQDGNTALMQAAYQEETSCLFALIQAKADINHQDRVRLGADVGCVLLWGSHDAMSTNAPNVSPFDPCV